jgi:hypothetical protein
MSKGKDLEALFDGRHFDREIIVLCVRWYLRYKLSLRDLVEMMAERGLSLAHTTIMRWVKRFTPEFVKRWNRFAIPAGRSWRVDETYLRIRGKMGLSVPGGGSGRPDSGLHAQGKARRGRGQSLFQQGHQTSGTSHRRRSRSMDMLPRTGRCVR